MFVLKHPGLAPGEVIHPFLVQLAGQAPSMRRQETRTIAGAMMMLLPRTLLSFHTPSLISSLFLLSRDFGHLLKPEPKSLGTKGKVERVQFLKT